jgi:SAM-dependent methyltransferase
MTPDPPSASARAYTKARLSDPSRNLWWNEDFVELIARRVRLADAEAVLDVGCGIGHWAAMLAPHLRATAHLTGLDVQEELLPAARERLAGMVDPDRLELVVGRAEQLPFDAATFDLATSQMVLIHVPDPLLVLREMRRVLKPGGTTLLVEPNNLASQLIPHSHAPDDDEYWLERMRFWLTCERGRRALGHGDLGIAEHLPELLRQAGFADVRVWLCDRVPHLAPPYDSEDSRALLATTQALYDQASYPFPKERGREYFIAGGGTSEDFDAAWQRRRDDQAHFLQLTRERVVSATVGRLIYVIAATAA